MSSKRKIDFKDIIIVLFSLLALIVLCGVIFVSKKNKERVNEELTSVSDNEKPILSNELNTILCNEANASGWIELYNPTGESYDLSGAVIYLNGNQVYSFDKNVKIESSEYLSVDIQNNPGEFDSNILSYIDKTGTRVFDWTIPKLSGSQSYGRIDDGGIEVAIMSETRGKSNKDAKIEEVNDLEFSVPSGFYDSSFTLSMRAPESYKIYYTTDGTKPTLSSEEYKGEFEIVNRSGASYYYAGKALGYAKYENFYPASVDMGTWVRAIMVDSNDNVVTEKFAIYFNGLKEDNKYADMPVISITTEENNLFDYFDGIYMAGRTREDAIARGENLDRKANYFMDWTRNAEITYFEKNFDKTYVGDATIQIIGDSTASDRQKPFKITIPQNVVKGSSIEELADKDGKLILTLSEKDSTYRVRDIIANRLVSGNSVGTADIQPCTLFINGEYWGCYILRKPYGEGYIKEHYGLINQDLTFASNSVWSDEFQNFYQYVVDTDMSVSANYAEFMNRADVESLADYICTNMFLANADFSLRSGTAWKTKNVSSEKYADGKWRWLLASMDNTMASKTSSTLTTKSIDSFLMNSFAKEPFIQSLMMNEEFRKALRSSMTKVIENSFTTSRIESTVDKVREELKRPIVATDNRFFANINDNSFNNECDQIKSFLNSRSEYIEKYIEEIEVQSGDINVLNEARGIIPESVEEGEVAGQ